MFELRLRYFIVVTLKTDRLVTTGERLWPVSRVRSRLATYYQRKKKELADSHPGFYDPELRSLFAEPDTQTDGTSAAAFLRQHRRFLTREVAQRCRVRKYAVDLVVRRLAQRARELRLTLKEDPAVTLAQVSITLTALLTEARYRELQYTLEKERPE